jgi:hypothetical protein
LPCLRWIPRAFLSRWFGGMRFAKNRSPDTAIDAVCG